MSQNQTAILAEATYPCKFDYKCKRTGKYNPAATIPVTIKNLNGEPATIQKLCACTHGGGRGCPTWRHYTDMEMGWYGNHER